jgi:hypothetical protein
MDDDYFTVSSDACGGSSRCIPALTEQYERPRLRIA